jgi:hypothetical protein
MAGGMRSGRGLTLAERSALSGVVPGRPTGSAGRRHCWVVATTPEHGPWPGLVLDWQRTAAGWRAFVVYLADSLADDGAGSAGHGAGRRPDGEAPRRTVAVQEWVDAARLMPAGPASR